MSSLAWSPWLALRIHEDVPEGTQTPPLRQRLHPDPGQIQR